MRFWKCEFCQNWDFQNVNVVKIEILKMWILSKLRFSKCEFLYKLRIFAPVWCIQQVVGWPAPQVHPHLCRKLPSIFSRIDDPWKMGAHYPFHIENVSLGFDKTCLLSLVELIRLPRNQVVDYLRYWISTFTLLGQKKVSRLFFETNLYSLLDGESTLVVQNCDQKCYANRVRNSRISSH